jgi:hypothetical protein
MTYEDQCNSDVSDEEEYERELNNSYNSSRKKRFNKK